MEKIKISIRNLVEFILRSGDIDNRYMGGAQKEAMQEGNRIHRKIQRQMGAGYHAEVPLKIEIKKEKYILVVEGRADGIFLEGEKVTIDEIKGVYMDINFLEEPILLHQAQAMCYAYIYGMQNQRKELWVQLTYCNLDTEEIRRFPQCFTIEELKDWFDDLIKAYGRWADYQYHARVIRQTSIAGLKFPYPYREGQKKLAADVYRTIQRGKNLFIQAPTGTGKTISAVFPAVKAVGEGLGDKIFYLTAKTITRTVAREAFDLLKENGYEGSVLGITAKEKMCPCEEMECNPDHCPCAKGHYDRINEAVFDLLHKTKNFTREAMSAQAEEFCVCPYEMCLDISLWVDVIICDYNYVFDPNVYLKRFFAEKGKGDYIFLVDEAHNLVERGREMYSAVLYKESFLEMKKIFQKYSKKITKSLISCNKHMLELKRECETYRVIDDVGGLVFSLMNLTAQLDEFFQERKELPEKKEIRDFYLELRHFMNMHERLDENYVIYTGYDPNGRFKLKLYCVNTSVNLQQCLDKGMSTVFFSATLLPIQYYKSLLSTVEDNYAVYATSIFSESKRLLVVANDVSSKYTRRNEAEFFRIAQYIYYTAKGRVGNYIVFFPSYQFMGQVFAQFEKMDFKNMDYILQESGMGEVQREKFLHEFTRVRENTLIGFCVLGGIFAEGIDLKREQLIGALVVGTGIPQISDEREILKTFYDENGKNGFDYAFRFPGMNKVLQAAGRVIRTGEDKGVILLLDERFLQWEYQKIFPREWGNFKVCHVESLKIGLKDFWGGQE
ncbi:ATP-dependent DNA helicase [Lachnospiraceae bacterium ZAX-1]